VIEICQGNRRMRRDNYFCFDIRARTQTISSAIYSLISEADGGYRGAAVVVVSILIAMAAMDRLRWFARRATAND